MSLHMLPSTTVIDRGLHRRKPNFETLHSLNTKLVPSITAMRLEYKPVHHVAEPSAEPILNRLQAPRLEHPGQPEECVLDYILRFRLGEAALVTQPQDRLLILVPERLPCGLVR